MTQHLFLIHGRSFKPDKTLLRKLWVRALRHGIERDHSAAKLAKFDGVKLSFIYYGDLSNRFLTSLGKPYDAGDDLADRRATSRALEQYSKQDFLEGQGKRNYGQLPGKSSIKEGLADIFAGPLHFARLSEAIITQVAPDMEHYWAADTEFGTDLRWRLTEPLAAALGRGEDILIIAHSLGTLITYDVLWKFSYYGEYQQIAGRKISRLITLGSPLSNETVKANLKGAGIGGSRRYPGNIQAWDNVAAEDDFISHDQKIANDYKSMLKAGLVESLTDHRIYNLAVRKGKTNPHHDAGYLIHPLVARLVGGWLK